MLLKLYLYDAQAKDLSLFVMVVRTTLEPYIFTQAASNHVHLLSHSNLFGRIDLHVNIDNIPGVVMAHTCNDAAAWMNRDSVRDGDTGFGDSYLSLKS